MKPDHRITPALDPTTPLPEVVQAIRNELKARLGLTRRSVRVRCYANLPDGDFFHVIVRIPGFPLRRIDRALAPFRYVRGFSDPASLKNRNVCVELDPALYFHHEAPLNERLNALPVSGFAVFHPLRFGHYRFEISRESGRYGDLFSLRKPRSGRPQSAESMALYLARVLVQSRQWRKLLAELTP
jgi:hypothetical protein